MTSAMTIGYFGAQLSGKVPVRYLIRPDRNCWPIVPKRRDLSPGLSICRRTRGVVRGKQSNASPASAVRVIEGRREYAQRE